MTARRSLALLWVLTILFGFSPPGQARPPVPGEPVASDPDLRLWLDASDPATLWQDVGGTIPATNGSAVARWDDKSLSGIVVSQANPTNTPAYTGSLSSLNSQSTVFFFGDGTGASDALSSSNGNSTGITGTAPLTLVTVWQNTGFTGKNYQHTFHMGHSIPQQAYGHSTARDGGLGSPIGNHYWGSGFDSYEPATTNATLALSSCDGTNDSWYVNGRFAGVTSITNLNISANQLLIGSRVNAILEGFTGHLAEVILFSKVLDAEERNTLGDYVEAKYGIAVADSSTEPRIDPATGLPNAGHPDLRLWLDAGDTNTVWQNTGGTLPATNGTGVARWDDKSLGRIIVSQSNAGNRPVYAAAISNLAHRAAVQFTGGAGGDALTSTTGNSTGIQNNAPLTLVTVWQNSGFTGQNYQHTYHMGNSQLRLAYGHSTSREGNEGSAIGNHYWGDAFNALNVPAALGVPTMTLSSYSGTEDTWFINGLPAGTRIVALNIGLSQVQIGSRLDPFVEGFTGDLAEVLLFAGVLGETERNALGYYIQDKYGIPIQDASLPIAFDIRSIAYESGLNPGDADMIFTWDSTSNSTYRLEGADDPEGPWTLLASGIPGKAASTTYTNSVMGAQLQVRQYFRMGEE